VTGAAAKGESSIDWKLSSDSPSLRGHSLEILPRAPETIDLLLQRSDIQGDSRSSPVTPFDGTYIISNYRSIVNNYVCLVVLYCLQHKI